MTGELESSIERKHRKIAIAYGWFVAKIMRASPNGMPDRFYANASVQHRCPFCNRGRVVLIEWKRRGKPATRQQEIRHEQLRRVGVEVYVIDNLADANRILGIGDEESEDL